MPRKGELRKLGDFFSSPAVKATKPKHEPQKVKNAASPASVISVESDWDGRGSKLAPSSQITSLTRSDSDESPFEQSPLARRKRQEAAAQAELAVDSSGSDDHVPLNLLGKRKPVPVDDSDGEPLQSPTKRRKTLVKGLKPTDEEENILEDLDQGVVLEARLRPAAKKTAFTKNLEKMKRKRLGLAKVSSPSNPGRDGSDESASKEGSDDAETPPKPIPGSRNPSGEGAKQIGNDDDDSSSESGNTDDFVIDDNGEEMGEISLPIQFSMNHRQPLAHSFKVFCQFLVHVACQPPHLRAVSITALLSGSRAGYFKPAINHLRRTLGSIRDSQVASTIWTSQFRKALETFPILEMEIIECEPYCHACRKFQAQSTRQARLTGQAYNRDGFEPFEEPSDDDGDDDSDSSSSSGGPALETFNLGQQCARKVSLFHAFAHWEYTLFKVIEEEIVNIETLNRERLLKKKKKKKKGNPIDTDDPDNIMELLDKKKVVSQQWKEIQDMMERAKHIDKRFAGEVD